MKGKWIYTVQIIKSHVSSVCDVSPMNRDSEGGPMWRAHKSSQDVQEPQSLLLCSWRQHRN